MLRTHAVALVLAAIACTPSPPADTGGTPPDTASPLATTPPPPPPLATDPTDTTTACAQPLPTGAAVGVTSLPIVTEEDFDFDGEGHLLLQQLTNLVGVDPAGTATVIAVDAAEDATGIRSLVSGVIALAQPNFSVVYLIDPATGVKTLLNFVLPNGLEAASDGHLYTTEFMEEGAVSEVDPTTGRITQLATAAYPNGIVLSHDEQHLYFTTSAGPYNGPTEVLALSRAADGRWDPDTLRSVHRDEAYLSSLAMDQCGNVYSVGYRSGEVFRIRASDGGRESVADLPGASAFTALHFGAGFGGFAADVLYVSDRQQVFGVEVGIRGSHVLAE